jgi:peptidoglycan/LPS O-acetylase OafA/YrhL
MEAPSASCDCSRPFHLGYRRWLDGLRGWAILFVLAFHLGILQGGSLGVDVFFVLSGFLITTLLLEEWQRRGSISLRHFYLRRALRLFPALFTLLVLYGLTSWWTLPSAEAADRYWEILAAGCYIANWATYFGIAMTGLGHTWSLSVEEQFYLLWPAALCAMLALRLSRRRIIQLVCAGIVACLLVRIGIYQTHRGSPGEKAAAIARMCVGLDTRADSLLAGCLVGLLVTGMPLPRSRAVIRGSGAAALVAAALLAYLALFSSQTQTAYFHGLFTVVALLVGAIILHLLLASSRAAALLLESAPIVGAGRISYGLYLYHMLIIHWMRPVGLGWSHLGTITAIALLSLAAALLSYFCIERPCLRLKDRFGHRRSARVPANVSAEPRAAA